MTDATRSVPRTSWREGVTRSDSDTIVVEAPVALVYNGISHVVMMATPADLEDLALGFSLSEGIIEAPGQLLDCEMQPRDKGLELQMTITNQRFAALKQRRRNLTGRTGCGLCGLESLEQAMPVLDPVHGDYSMKHSAIQKAAAALGGVQSLKQDTGGVHGAIWCNTRGDIELVREDVGRHNALDKLLGAMQQGDHSAEGCLLVTSRASYEMVAKVASCGFPILAAVSAPTSLAVQQAEDCGLTLLGFVQPGRQVIYTHPQRIIEDI
ncbi:MAG: formate dehydrogenase accessory sulfurtransferase FdhD [Haliea sp.]|jgi:FdhD protein|nr:formate dehydrogenase accessory sulfurtransferase FdhD [Haliea sp.]